MSHSPGASAPKVAPWLGAPPSETLRSMWIRGGNLMKSVTRLQYLKLQPEAWNLISAPTRREQIQAIELANSFQVAFMRAAPAKRPDKKSLEVVYEAADKAREEAWKAVKADLGKAEDDIVLKVYRAGTTALGDLKKQVKHLKTKDKEQRKRAKKDFTELENKWSLAMFYSQNKLKTEFIGEGTHVLGLIQAEQSKLGGAHGSKNVEAHHEHIEHPAKEHNSKTADKHHKHHPHSVHHPEPRKKRLHHRVIAHVKHHAKKLKHSHSLAKGANGEGDQLFTISERRARMYQI